MEDARFNFQEYLSMEGSKYISYAKTFTLPMLQYPFGGQIEARVVYDPESLMPRNIIISTKGRYGQNNLDIFEVNFELEGWLIYICLFVSLFIYKIVVDTGLCDKAS